jgi:hypothetical protein
MHAGGITSMKRSLMVGSFVVAVALLVLGGSAAEAQKGAKKRAAAAKKLNDVALIVELQKTAFLLSKANRDYKGHRAAAVKHIHHAVRHLKEEAKVRGLKVGSDYTGPEPQPVSDAQLKQAITNLKATLEKVNNLAVTARRTKAGEHVGNAVGELKLALEVSALNN